MKYKKFKTGEHTSIEISSIDSEREVEFCISPPYQDSVSVWLNIEQLKELIEFLTDELKNNEQ